MNVRVALRRVAWVLVLCPAVAALARTGNVEQEHFIERAIKANNSEIQLAHLVLQHSKSNSLDHFAQVMIQDHTRLNAQIKPLAQSFHVSPPSGLTAGAKTLEVTLKPLSGKQFNDAYIKAMVISHRRALRAFQEEAKDGTNAKLRKAAKKALPVIEQHLQMARQLAQKQHVSVPKA